jgi:hypothetical protein
MANASVFPTLSQLTYFSWQGGPRLSAPIGAADTTIAWTVAPLDKNGAVITTPFLFGITDEDGNTETVLAVNGANGASGLSATGCVRDIEVSGIDYTTTNGSGQAFEQDSPVFCNITSVVQSMMIAALQGMIATGGAGLIIGTDADGTVTVSRSTGVGTSVGWLRWNTTGDKVQFSDDGTTWVNNTDVSASVLFKVSAADTTPGYANDKITVTSGSGATVTKSITSPAGNEKLNIDVALNTASLGVADHLIYTPAFLTGGNAAEATFNNWLAVLDGSFRITINGTLRNVTGINFTGVTSMADVATMIQTAIRALTLSTETVAWSVNHFIITSALTTSSSAITVTSATGGGTDISGAGASNWMDCDTGNGVVTNAVLNRTADAGQLIKLDASGNIADKLFNTNPLYALGASGSDAYAVSIPATPTAYYTGMKVDFKADVANTGACTINVNGLGAKDIKKNYNAALETGDIVAGQLVELEYDGTNFQAMSFQSVKSAIQDNVPNTFDTFGTFYTYSVYPGSNVGFTLNGATQVQYLNGVYLNQTASPTTAQSAALIGGILNVNSLRWTDPVKLKLSYISCKSGISTGAAPFGAGSWWYAHGLIQESSGTIEAYADITSNADSRVCFAHYNGRIYALTCNRTVGITATDLMADGGNTDLKQFKIEWNPGVSALFYINGVLVATHTTNLPTNASTIKFLFGVNRQAASNERIFMSAIDISQTLTLA